MVSSFVSLVELLTWNNNIFFLPFTFIMLKVIVFPIFLLLAFREPVKAKSVYWRLFSVAG